jgi:hypothetical protein
LEICILGLAYLTVRWRLPCLQPTRRLRTPMAQRCPPVTDPP